MDKTDIWNKCLPIIKEEVSDLSFSTWIESLKPVDIIEDVFYLMADNAFKQGQAENFKSLIENALKLTQSVIFKVRIITSETELSFKKPNQATNQNSDKALFGTPIPEYTFENFIVGSSNSYAHAASVAVAEHTGNDKDYLNPLFIYGGSGLGKTHLMNAIGNHVLKNFPKKKVVYTTCERFVDFFVTTARETKEYGAFRNIFRACDYLLLDDIQFIEKKTETIVEFFNTFEALSKAGKHIVITCDKPAVELKTLDDRLISRLSHGLTVDIAPPEYETRLAIIREHLRTDGIVIENNIIEYIASNIESNVRELEGALKTIIYQKKLLKGDLSLEQAKDLLKYIISPYERKITPEIIVGFICEYCNVNIDQLNSSARTQNIVFPRHLAMYILKNKFNMSFVAIGQLLNRKDHTTVMHGCKKIEKGIQENDPLIKSALNHIESRINGKEL